MSSVLHSRSAILLVMSIVMGAASAAATPDKLDKLIRDFGPINHDMQKLQAAQSALMQQKAPIETMGGNVVGQQTTLIQQGQAYNPLVIEQKPHSDQDPSGCKDAAHGGCASGTKKLKKLSMKTDAGALAPETRQTDLDLAYSQYREKAEDWNAEEREITTALNSVYRALNAWADQADSLISSDSFQGEVKTDHAEKYCPLLALADGTLSSDVLMRYATDADRCLKYVAAKRHASPAGRG